MSSYLKQFLIVGLPIILFFTVFLSIMLGLAEGLVPGLLIGLFVGGFLSLLLGFMYSKSTKNLMTDWVEDMKSRPHKIKSLSLTLLPILILFLSAILTRISGQILIPYIVSIVLVITLYLFLDKEKVKRAISEGELPLYMIRVIIMLLRFTITYLIFVLIIYGFNFEKIRQLVQR
jgi:hypothetical protein